MPFIYKSEGHGYPKISIWEIREAERYFYNSLQGELDDINNDEKRIQKKAGRYILGITDRNFPMSNIVVKDNSKPYVKDNAFYFSISHSKNFVACIISKKTEVGIDIEMITNKAIRVSSKFLTAQELQLTKDFENQPMIFSLLWSCKECFYKWKNQTGISLKSIQVQTIDFTNNAFVIVYQNREYIGNIFFGKNFVATWLVSPF